MSLKPCRPAVTRKKKVPNIYNPNTFRVLNMTEKDDPPRYTPVIPKEDRLREMRDRVERNVYARHTRVLPQILPDHRAHQPQGENCFFLTKNHRTLNEPICCVSSPGDRGHWMMGDGCVVAAAKRFEPPYTRDTTSRSDFQYDRERVPKGATKHSANPCRGPALGIAPDLPLWNKDGSLRIYQEKLSYEHAYNSRTDPNLPFKGKRIGGFAYSQLRPDSKVLEQLPLVHAQSVSTQATRRESPTTNYSCNTDKPISRILEHPPPNCMQNVSTQAATAKIACKDLCDETEKPISRTGDMQNVSTQVVERNDFTTDPFSESHETNPVHTQDDGSQAAVRISSSPKITLDDGLQTAVKDNPFQKLSQNTATQEMARKSSHVVPNLTGD